MTKLPFVLAIGLSFAAVGCKKKGGDCTAAINHSMDLGKDDMKKMSGADDKMVDKLKELGIQHCTDDKWPDDVIACMTDAKTEADSQGCYGKLTKAQQDKMQTAMMETMVKAAGAAGANGDAGGSAAPAGSAGSTAPAVGSAAAAGSAAH
jgi:hypothetical protein